MNVVFRVDAGPRIGLGHLQRCLSLALALAAEGTTAHFVVRGDGPTYGWVRERGFAVTGLPPEATPETDLTTTLNCLEGHRAQAVVVDCRAVASESLGELRRAGYFVVSIDDLAEMAFPSNLVVNPNIYAPQLSYRSAAADTRFLLGTDYVMLRPEFWNVPPRPVEASVRRVLLTLGGMDRYNLMPELLRLLDDIAGGLAVTALMGPFSENRREVEEVSRAARHPVRLIHAPESVVDIMREADLAISGGGQTLYELARVGCPTVALQVAPDQQHHLRALAEAGLVRLGGCGDGDLAAVRGAILSLLADPEARAAMSAAGQRLVDGQGALRVARAILAEVGGGGRPQGLPS